MEGLGAAAAGAGVGAGAEAPNEKVDLAADEPELEANATLANGFAFGASPVFDIVDVFAGGGRVVDANGLDEADLVDFIAAIAIPVFGADGPPAPPPPPNFRLQCITYRNEESIIKHA